MNIPLDELYNFLTSDMVDDTLIYHYQQHGSRKLQDLKQLNNNVALQKACFMIMHDQEPLMPSFYNRHYLEQHVPSWYLQNFGEKTANLLKIPEWRDRVYNSNLAFVRLGLTQYDHNILVHSELRSQELEFYKNNGFETVYWWCHAMIARDWYRYAQHDPLLSRPRNPKFMFNIYARAWHYPREYRLKFLDSVIELGIQDHCQVKFNKHDNDIHYSQYQYHNHDMRIKHSLDCFDTNALGPTASASYSSQDYSSAWFDVVLETLFDDDRLHLTEKTLRPIACGVPFLLCGTHHSLAYLRNYGFKTFGDVIDESYDEIPNPGQRLDALVKVMADICQSDIKSNPIKRKHIEDICRYNRERFFSLEFSQLVFDEFFQNLKLAKSQCELNRRGKNYSELVGLMEQASITPFQSESRSC